MSRTSIKERNKAIRKVWEREQELVKEGKGTRDWTKEQQQDILDPDKGKAYDDQGRAFEGQHMKSAAEYPEYQGDPNNIQFLTREEHLEAHNDHSEDPEEWITPEKMEEMFGDFSYAIAFSRSHMKVKDGKSERPRFHVYFQIEEVTDEKVYAGLKMSPSRSSTRFSMIMPWTRQGSSSARIPEK